MLAASTPPPRPMHDIRHDLLQPSLSGAARPAAAPHSQVTGALTAFFGGPLALATLFAIDAGRIGRLPRDLAAIAAIAAAHLGWLAFAHLTPSGAAVREALSAELGRNGTAMVERAIALAGFAVMVLVHRRAQRSAALFGLPRPRGLVTGTLLIVAGHLMSVVLDHVFQGGAAR